MTYFYLNVMIRYDLQVATGYEYIEKTKAV